MPEKETSAPPRATADRRAVQVVVTPDSGAERAAATARWVCRVLVRHGYPTTVQCFRDLAGLSEWARTCAPDFGYLVCIGGEATLSAAAPASIRCNIPFVPVANGVGNSLAGVFGHARRADAVLALLEHGQVHRVDVGVIDGREIFLSHRSYGFLERVERPGGRGQWRPIGRLLRHLGDHGVARRAVVGPRLASIAVEVDGTPVADDAVMVTVANVETYRGFLTLTPSVSPIDGMFDVLVVPRVSGPGLGWRLLGLVLPVPGRWRRVAVYRGRHVVVTTPRRREELLAARRALPLLVEPGAVESIPVRARAADAVPSSASLAPSGAQPYAHRSGAQPYAHPAGAESFPHRSGAQPLAHPSGAQPLAHPARPGIASGRS